MMKKSSLTRIQLVLVVILAALVFVRLIAGPPDPTGLVVFVDLEPAALRHAAFEVQQPAALAVQATGSFDPAAVPSALAAHGWVVRRSDRTVVWRMEPATAAPGRGHTAVVAGDTFDLDPGVYDVYFATYGGVYDAGRSRRARWHNDAGRWRLILRPVDDDARVRVLPETQPAKLAPQGDDLLWTSAPQHDQQERAYLFEVDRPTRLRLYAVGEFADEPLDYAWIEDAASGHRGWQMTKADTGPAGGLERNRLFRGDVMLDAGTYRAVAVTDRRHAYGDWEGNPPFDPAAWGLSIYTDDPGAVSAFDPWRSRTPLIRFTRVPDDAERLQRFEVLHPVQVVVYAVGEVTGDGSTYDYAELLKEEVDRKERVWRMSREGSTHAGGGDKNRLEVAFLRLEPGVYRLRYETDGSHAYDDWNTAKPDYPERWGVTLFPMAEASDGALRLLSDDTPTTDVDVARLVHDGPPLVSWTRLGNDASREQAFELEAETRLHIVALGEITRSDRHDCGWIENAETGEPVWEMRLDNTRSGGGTSRNRRFDGVVTLPSGRYVARFRTDFSHSYGDFGDEAPSTPDAWGMTIYRVAADAADNR